VKPVIKKRSFKIDVFGAKVHMYMCANAEAIVTVGNKIMKKFGEEPIDFSVAGLTFTPDQSLDTVYIFLCPEHIDVNTLTHETQHILHYIMDYYNIEEQSDSKEVSANLSGYINEKVFAFVKSCGMEVKY
jgi:hypothetical protein